MNGRQQIQYIAHTISPTILNSIITYIPSPVFPPLSFSPYPFQPGLWSPWKGRNYGYTWTIPDFRVSGNFWLVIFKIRYLCLPLFYETRTTPSCHPYGCAYRQLWYCQFRQECWPFWYLSWWKKVQLKEDKTNPDIISYGFGEYRIIQDYPIRGRATYLHVRKRKWLDKSSNEIFSYDWDLSEFDGTRLNSEFVSFLKEGDWIYSCEHLCACGTLWRKRTDSS